ncbi:hypothetical protein [Cellulomonas sp. RIT-PI-Y]|uniref:hypothetical protein n=1 Tax=Cellulomonas sp. RIT-PI-Y TaxID=3035297 RepID=UPI0021DAFABC|nr:hypothetical protein [Cellulomonas sp. RIT-PI-Y]
MRASFDDEFVNDEAPSGVDNPRLHRALRRAGGTVLNCTELTWSGEGGPATGAFSRWGLGDDTLLTVTVAQREHSPEVAAATAIRSWFADGAGTGSPTKDELRAAMQVQPESVTPTDEALLVDGAPAAGVVATARGVTARSADQGGAVVTVVHANTVNGPIELVTEIPVLN